MPWVRLALVAIVASARVSAWPPPRVPSRSSGEGCPYSFRVYSYEFDESFRFNRLYAEARAKPARSHLEGEHLLAQFSLEFILADFFRDACVRTRDPSVADFYFVPFFSDIEYRADGRPDGPSAHGQALLDVLERNDTRGWEREFGVSGEWRAAARFEPLRAPRVGRAVVARRSTRGALRRPPALASGGRAAGGSGGRSVTSSCRRRP